MMGSVWPGSTQCGYAQHFRVLHHHQIIWTGIGCRFNYPLPQRASGRLDIDGNSNRRGYIASFIALAKDHFPLPASSHEPKAIP
jgi:hypothetical protein